MNKKLLFTTLLGCITTFSANAATVQTEAFDMPIELKVGGYMTWYSVYANQQKTAQIDTILGNPIYIGQYNNVDIMGDAEIYFSGKTTLRNGVEIGAMVQLEAGTDSDSFNQVIDETYMTVDSKWGRVIVGNVKNVTSQMSVTAPDVSITGLQDTGYTSFVLMPEDFANNLATYALIDDISPKLSYITPTVSDITFGFSLMPGNKKKGKDSSNLLNADDGLKLFKYGFSTIGYYEKEFGYFDMQFSSFYTMYKPNLEANGINAPEKNINEYGAGINFDIGNWGVGGSYKYTNMSKETAKFIIDKETAGKGYAWDAGVMYSFGPVETSLNFFQSKAQSILVDGTDTMNLYQFSVKYGVISGVDLFMDAGYIEFDAADSSRSKSNKGPAVAIGVDLSF